MTCGVLLCIANFYDIYDLINITRLIFNKFCCCYLIVLPAAQQVSKLLQQGSAMSVVAVRNQTTQVAAANKDTKGKHSRLCGCVL